MMCLIIDNEQDKIILRKFQRKNKLKFYKVVHISYDGKKLLPPWQNYKHYEIGLNKPYGLYITFNRIIEGGVFHGYRTKKRALKQARYLKQIHIGKYNTIVIPVYCKRNDFVHAGTNGDVCFLKMTIKKEDYNKALKSKSIYGVVGR